MPVKREANYLSRRAYHRPCSAGARPGARLVAMAVVNKPHLAVSLLILMAAVSACEARRLDTDFPPSAIALVASQWKTDGARSLAQVTGLGEDGICLFRSDRSGGTLVLAAGTTLFHWADLSPDSKLISYGFTYPNPEKIFVIEENRKHGVGVVDIAGHERFRVPGGVSSAWSPSGEELAVLVRGRVTPPWSDSLVVWRHATGSRRGFGLPERSEGIQWLSRHLIAVGGYILDSRNGRVVPSGRIGNRLSQDREYTLCDDASVRVCRNLGALDLTTSIIQVCGSPNLRRVIRACWVPWRGSGHVLAVGTQDETQGSGKPTSHTSFIDAEIPELLAMVPGQLVGMAGDGVKLVVLREDGLHFLNPRSDGKAPSASNLAYGSGLGVHPQRVRIEVLSTGWSFKRSGTDTLGLEIFNVGVGDSIGVERSRFNFYADPAAFRVTGIRSNGFALMESRFVPHGQQFRRAYRHRFIVTNSAIHVQTPSDDAGAIFRLRIVPE